jgi:hypothetical protein
MDKYSPGIILEAKKRGFHQGKHYIIYLDEIDEYVFKGAMLTTSDLYANNVKFKKEDFLVEDKEGNPYKVFYQNSFFVDQPFMKKAEWGPFKVVGELSDSGINRINDELKGKKTVDYSSEYLPSLQPKKA